MRSVERDEAIGRKHRSSRVRGDERKRRQVDRRPDPKGSAVANREGEKDTRERDGEGVTEEALRHGKRKVGVVVEDDRYERDLRAEENDTEPAKPRGSDVADGRFGSDRRGLPSASSLHYE